MSKSTRPKGSSKPSKPYPDFPLFPHATGRWAKKVRGRLHYFGSTTSDPQGEAALDRWLEVRDELLAGRTPVPRDDGLAIAQLCNHFLTYKQQLVDSGELAPRTFDRYHTTCAFLVETFGKNRVAHGLRPDEFQSLRTKMAKRWGPVALSNEIQMVRSIFRYGYEAGLLESSIRFGPGFKKPSAKTLRQTRSANGPRMFERQELLLALEHATTNMRAMTLLGINGALGNTDLGLLPTKLIQLDSGWLEYPRRKTGIERRIPLWPETCEAIRVVLRERNQPNDPNDAELLFVGRRGQNYIGNHKGQRVTQEMARVLRAAGIEGRTFYDLRRTFQTIAEGSRDLVAVRSIMGHAPSSGDMSAVYRERISDERLKAVVEVVRDWLFGRVEGG